MKNRQYFIITLFSLAVRMVSAETWNVAGGGSWDTATNWLPVSVPDGAGATANLLNAIAAPANINLPVGRSVGTLNIDSGFGYTLSGVLLSIPGGSINVTNSNGNAIHTLSNQLGFSGTSSIDVQTGAAFPLTISGMLSGTGSFSKVGSGTVVLSGNNTYAGIANINAGTLSLSGGDYQGDIRIGGGTYLGLAPNIMSNAITVTLNSGTFDLNGNVETIDLFVMGGGTYSASGTLTLLGASGTGLIMIGGTTIPGDINLFGSPGNANFFHQGGVGPATLSGNVGLGNSDRSFVTTLVGQVVELSGVVSGIGGINASGPGTVILSGGSPNSFTGPLTVGSGTVFLNKTPGVDAVGGDVVVSGGGLLQLGGSSQIPLTSMMTVSSGTFDLNGVIDTFDVMLLNGGTYDSGGGTLGLGSLTFSSGTYASSGGTTNLFSASTALNVAAGTTIPSGETINMANGGGGGNVAFTGPPGTANLSGNIDLGTIDRTFTTPSTGSIIACSGGITGVGGINKQGPGILQLMGNKAYIGPTTVSGGTLNVNGTLASSVTVNPGALMSGDATVVNLTNNGTVEPGNSIGTTIVNGNFVQGAGGILNIDINDLVGDFVDISGTASLAGTLNVVPEPGNYLVGVTYTILEADGGLGGTTFDAFNFSSLGLGISYFPNSVVLTVLTTNMFFDLLDMIPSGNPRNVAEYIIGIQNILHGSDLCYVLQLLGLLRGQELVDALNSLTPARFGSLELSSLETSTTFSNIFAKHINELSCSPRSCRKGEGDKSVKLWLEPFGNLLSTNRIESLMGFDADSGGIAVGLDTCFPSRVYLGVGGGYAHTEIDWQQNRGRGRVNQFVVSSYAGYFREHLDLDASVMGGWNFYELARKIRFGDLLQRTAQSDPFGAQANVHFGIGTPFYLTRASGTSVAQIYPFGKLDFNYLGVRRFAEHGADSINLDVRTKMSQFLRGEVGTKISRTFNLSRGCVAPYLGVSWVGKYRLNSGNWKSSFIGVPGRFDALTFSKGINLVSPEAGFTYTRSQGSSISGEYKGEFGKYESLHLFSIRCDWLF